eukprot:2812701-Rhodomonas_salina.1
MADSEPSSSGGMEAPTSSSLGIPRRNHRSPSACKYSESVRGSTHRSILDRIILVNEPTYFFESDFVVSRIALPEPAILPTQATTL